MGTVEDAISDAALEGLVERLGLEPRWRQALRTVERMVGGRVVAAERQPRWRPAFFLEVERDGERVPIYFRGDRTEGSGVYGLEHELGVLRVLEAHGIPVPHVYGFCDEPRGIVMARAPGRANLANAVDETERRAVLDEYMEILAAMHAIDVTAFEAVGLSRPTGPRELALADLPKWEESFRARKRRPEPLIELVLTWLHSHLPLHRSRATFVAGDSGQFLFESGRVTAVIDLELAFLGDPLADLAAMRSRDASEPLGDLSRGFARYAERTGEEIDLGALHFHTARFALNTPLAVAPLCAEPPPGFNYAQYLSWYLVYGRLPLEVIADVEGIELAEPGLPEPVETRFAGAYDSLASVLSRGERDYRADTALRIAEVARRLDLYGARLEEQSLDEVATLLGRRPRDWRAADEALEALVRDAGRARFAELVRLLHRRTRRLERVLRPALAELADARFQRIRSPERG